MAITAAQVKELRELTGIGMMECKKALTEANGDIDLAVEGLRKKGLSKAAKKADRETTEGGIKIVTEGGNAYVVSIGCETDFLANTDKFTTMLESIAVFLKDNGEEADRSRVDCPKDYLSIIQVIKNIVFELIYKYHLFG